MTMQTETALYTANGTNLRGYLAYDDSVDGERPGVIVVHEWWGLDEYIKARARQLAELGYCALAIDMFGDGATADNPNDAGAQMNAVLNDMNAGTARLQAGFQTLRDHERVDGSRVAAIGYCFGGAMVLHMARIGMPLKGVVSFHGALGSFHRPAAGEVQARVLVCHGAADEFVPQSDVDDFKAEMEAAGADYEFVAYEGALHGFTSKAADDNGRKFGLPLAYNEAADQASWQAMQSLLQSVF